MSSASFKELLLGSKPTHVFAEPAIAMRLSAQLEEVGLSSLDDPLPESSALVAIYLLRPAVASAVRLTHLLEAQRELPREHHVFFCPTKSSMVVHILQVSASALLCPSTGVGLLQGEKSLGKPRRPPIYRVHPPWERPLLTRAAARSGGGGSAPPRPVRRHHLLRHRSLGVLETLPGLGSQEPLQRSLQLGEDVQSVLRPLPQGLPRDQRLERGGGGAAPAQDQSVRSQLPPSSDSGEVRGAFGTLLIANAETSIS